MSYKSGYVAIVGKPNVGKSTLMNCLLGEKLSIVNPKPGTTRDKILGVLSRPEGQIVFIDTPGLYDSKLLLGQYMSHQAKSSFAEADLILLMTDVQSGFGKEDRELIQSIEHSKKTAFVLINKVDAVNKRRVLPVMEEAVRMNLFKEIIPISCLKRENLDILLNLIFENLVLGKPLYPVDELTDRPERFFVKEMIREKALCFLKEEVPHAIAVEIEEMKEREGKNLWFIQSMIFVEKESQKAILIGTKGEMLKKIGEESRREIERFLNKKVYLKLWVKVLEDWRNDGGSLKRLGYDNG